VIKLDLRHSIDGSQVEPLIIIGTAFKMEQSTDGTFTVSFSCFSGTNNNTGYELLKSEAIVTVDDNDFQVKHYSNTNFSKSVVAISTFFDHAKTRNHEFLVVIIRYKITLILHYKVKDGQQR